MGSCLDDDEEYTHEDWKRAQFEPLGKHVPVRCEDGKMRSLKVTSVDLPGWFSRTGLSTTKTEDGRKINYYGYDGEDYYVEVE